MGPTTFPNSIRIDPKGPSLFQAAHDKAPKHMGTVVPPSSGQGALHSGTPSPSSSDMCPSTMVAAAGAEPAKDGAVNPRHPASDAPGSINPSPAPGLSCAEATLKASSSSREIVEHAPIDVSVGPVFSVNMPPRVPCSLPPCYPTERGECVTKRKGPRLGGVGKWGLLLLMEVKILSWNVRGMNDPNKRVIIKVGVREWGANLVCFQETKMEVLSDAIVRSVWGSSWVKYDWIPAVGSARGILLMWDDRSLEVKEIRKRVFSLAALVKDRVSGVEWGFSGVYGPVGEGSNVSFWEELANIMGNGTFHGF
nr:uncharacterized protein LOC117277208 [Nicotiana tomentosiformis]